MSVHLLIGLGVLLAIGVAIYLEDQRRAGHDDMEALIAIYRAGHDDMEALIDATREQLPDHVPAEWVKEFRQ